MYKYRSTDKVSDKIAHHNNKLIIMRLKVAYQKNFEQSMHALLKEMCSITHGVLFLKCNLNRKKQPCYSLRTFRNELSIQKQIIFT